jgi:hypothetical protein
MECFRSGQYHYHNHPKLRQLCRQAKYQNFYILGALMSWSSFFCKEPLAKIAQLQADLEKAKQELDKANKELAFVKQNCIPVQIK